MKKYLLRAVRYALRLVVILAVLFAIMIAFGLMDIGNSTAWQAIFLSRKGLILVLVLIGFAAIYPSYSFGTMNARAELPVERERIVNAFASRGYAPIKEEPGVWMTFRAVSFGKRFALQFDDEITVTAVGRHVEIEGMKKETARIVARIDAFV